MDPDAVVTVFNHWRVMMGHGRAQMDVKRAQAIRDRMRDGYTVEDLCLAIDGCVSSAWHMGENDRRTRYDSITLILRDADHVDRFISMGEQAHRMIEQRKQRQEVQEALARPPTEEEKERVRELLKNCRIRRVA